MAGQLIPKGERKWLVKVFLGCDAKTGKRQFHTKIIRGNKKDAQKYLNSVQREKDLGTLIEPVTITFNEFLDRWIEAIVSPKIRERTLADYVDKINRYIRPALGGMKLSNLRPLHIQLLYAKMRERGLSARTVRYVHSIISPSLKYAVKSRMLASNPAEDVELPRQERKEMKSLSPTEATSFLKAATQDKHGSLFALALTTGMRPEEYLALTWPDIDFNKGTVTIQRTLVQRKGGGWYFGEPKTLRSRRTIPLPSSVISLLLKHRREQLERKLKAGIEYQEHDLVFATDEGTPLNIRNITSRHFKLILKNAGLPEMLRLYDLRHTCATLLLSENEHPKVVSERLGHASITLTLDTYSHVLPTMQQAATERLEKILFQVTS